MNHDSARNHSGFVHGVTAGLLTSAPLVIAVFVIVSWPSQFPLVAMVLGTYILARFLCWPWLILGRDDVRRELILTRHYLTWHRETRIPLERITGIEEVRKPGTLFARHVVVITDDGMVTPVRSARRGRYGKEDLCGRVRSLVWDAEGRTRSDKPDNRARAAIFLKLFTVGGRLGVAASILCLGVCLLIGWRTVTFVLSARRATGTITKLERVESPAPPRGGGTQVAFVPHFRFQDEQAHTHEVRGIVAGPESLLKVGDRVSLLYDARRPKTARLDDVGNVWGLTYVSLAVLACVGVLSLRVGRLLGYYERKMREGLPGQASHESFGS